VSLIFREVRLLSLAPGEHPRGLKFLSAASGLVRVGERFYVVADDELQLGMFTAGSAAPLRLVRLFEGELPAGARKRKAVKPDFESLLRFPPPRSPGGALLVLAPDRDRIAASVRCSSSTHAASRRARHARSSSRRSTPSWRHRSVPSTSRARSANPAPWSCCSVAGRAASMRQSGSS
jgi:hypothetical protein